MYRTFTGNGRSREKEDGWGRRASIAGREKEAYYRQNSERHEKTMDPHDHGLV